MAAPSRSDVTKATFWSANFKPNPQAKLRLFCFPYAGGSAIIFRDWANSLSPAIEVFPVQLPGRGHRMRETPYVNLSDLVSGIAAEVEPFLDMPFAFFGHSLGAMISFELARKLRRLGGPQPAHLFVSGSPAPHIVSSTATYNLPYDEFIEALRDLNGTPSEVLEHPELMQIMMPLLRADFEVHDTYKYLPGPRLDCPITAFGGLEDGNAQREDIEGWRDHTSGSFSFWMLPGDHFFLHTSQSRLMQILSRGLNPIVDTIKQR